MIFYESICKAQKTLPKGLCLKIEWAYHPLEVQRKIYFKVKNKLKKQNPTWGESKLEKETEKFVAPLDIAPHAAGAAVDLTIIDKNGKELDMGQRSKPYSKACYTNSKNISKKAKENRALLIKIMKKAGFVNYPIEWWHWSYGDRDWAITKGKKRPIYGPLHSF